METIVNKKYGIVAIVGKPNVGKSSLINAISKSKVSIVSAKPQTTRNAIKELYEDDDSVIIFTDTPGYHNEANKLDIFLNHEVEVSYKEANLVLLLTSMDKPLSEDDYKIIDHIKENKKEKIILVVSKAETAKTQELIDQRVASLKQHLDFLDVIQISSTHNINIDKLLNTIKQYLKSDVVTHYFRSKADKTDKFWVQELIREQCLELLKYEVPHGIGIEINESKYDSATNHWLINATIIIEKDSHKPIVIGKDGQVIKQIGMNTRKQLLATYDCDITLKLFVKVEKNWRDNNTIVKGLGYKINQ